MNLYLENVTEQEFDNIDRGIPLIAIGILPHEHKMSVVNMLLRRPHVLESDEPIKSKEELIIQCGYRRFKCCPIFSQLSNGTVHKVCRFLANNNFEGFWGWAWGLPLPEMQLASLKKLDTDLRT